MNLSIISAASRICTETVYKTSRIELSKRSGLGDEGVKPQGDDDKSPSRLSRRFEPSPAALTYPMSAAGFFMGAAGNLEASP
jgi:hypothetical protein